MPSRLLNAMVFTALATLPARATPVVLSHQGYLLEADDTPVNGAVDLTVRIWTSASGGASPAWVDTFSNHPVFQGYYELRLGDTAAPGHGSSALPANLFTQDLYLGIQVGSGAELTPRVRLTTVPAAARAGVAEDALLFGGRAPDAFAQLSPASAQTGSLGVTGSGTFGGGVAAGAAVQVTTGSNVATLAANGLTWTIGGGSPAASVTPASNGSLTIGYGGGSDTTVVRGGLVTATGVVASQVLQVPVASTPPGCDAQGKLYFDSSAGTLQLFVCDGSTWRTASTGASGGTGGSGGAKLIVNPIKLTFSSTTASLEATLYNVGGADATSLSVSATSGFGASSNCGTTLASGAACTLTFALPTTGSGVVTGTGTASATGTSFSVALSGLVSDPVYGSGADGSLTLASTKNLNTESLGASVDLNGTNPDGAAFLLAGAPLTSTLTTTTDVTGKIMSGDRLLLVNLQGTSTDTADVGNWEILQVSGTPVGTSIPLVAAPTRTYAGTSFANQKVVVQRLPQYDSVTVNAGGVITTPALNLAGSPITTGIVAFLVRGTLTVSGSITAAARGFAGGLSDVYSGGPCKQGDSYSGTGAALHVANGGGGGGGEHIAGVRSGGGGGGGYATTGETGYQDNNPAGGVGGATYGGPTLSRIYLGSGGGGGSENTVSTEARGGRGGGMVILHAKSVVLAGPVNAAGEQGVSPGTGSKDGGGGGSGGSIKIKAETVSLGTGLVNAAGGARSVGNLGGTNSAGGFGGEGRVAVEYKTSISGSTTPAANLTVY